MIFARACSGETVFIPYRAEVKRSSNIAFTTTAAFFLSRSAVSTDAAISHAAIVAILRFACL
jgi:hypothetical protein